MFCNRGACLGFMWSLKVLQITGRFGLSRVRVQGYMSDPGRELELHCSEDWP